MMVRKGIGIHLYGVAASAVSTGLMRAVNPVETDFYKFLIQTAFTCRVAWHDAWQHCLTSFNSSILYGTEGYMPSSSQHNAILR